MQITKNVHALRISFQIPVGPGRKLDRFVYVYLIYTDRVWMIDTGVAAAGPVIADHLRKTGKNVEDVACIVLTHAHPDHIGSAKFFQGASGCVVAAHPAERSWIEDVDLQARERPVPGFHSLVTGPVTVSRILREGDLIELGQGQRLQVIETPGHSYGSLSLLLEKVGVLFSGDAVPVAGEMPIYEDAAASATSVKKLMSLQNINFLLSSWDDPREGRPLYDALESSLRYLDRIHEAVLTTEGPAPSDPLARCTRVLSALGLPAAAANPLVARSFVANLQASDRRPLSGRQEA